MYESYHFKIDEHAFQYSISAHPNYYDPVKNRSTQTEFCAITIKATMIHPKIICGEHVKVNILGSRSSKQNLEKNEADRETQLWIGGINLFRDSSDVYCTLPDDRIMHIYHMISSGIFTEFIAQGEPLKRKKAHFRSLFFNTHFDEEEYY